MVNQLYGDISRLRPTVGRADSTRRNRGAPKERFFYTDSPFRAIGSSYSLGEIFGTGWPERQMGKNVFFHESFLKTKPACRIESASRCESIRFGCGGWI
jgi:hypothetical protein